MGCSSVDVIDAEECGEVRANRGSELWPLSEVRVCVMAKREIR